ncbi:MAG: Wzz/FepE/Etk N-terminal domain-containing protein [Flavisolibacter sp.]
MPDLFFVFTRRWKLIILITIVATLLAFGATIISPKKYLSIATALPANSVLSDKARIFNSNVQSLYSDIGTADELDKIEGTATLDTIYIKTSKDYNLAGHYLIADSGESIYKAAIELKNNSRISRSAYGELKVKVWDKDRNLAAALANSLLQNLQVLHQHLQNQGNSIVLQRIKEDYAAKRKLYQQLNDSVHSQSSAENNDIFKAELDGLMDQIQQDDKLIGQYQLALNTNPQVLLTVENARPSLWPDKPKVLETILLTFFASFLFSYLISLLLESIK